MKRRLLSTMLALCMMLALLPGTALAATTVASGKCGTNATWSLDSSGTLTVKGSGDMEDYYFSGGKYSPWYSRRGDIVRVVVENGISSVGYNAFAYCSNMISVTIKGASTIDREAFNECGNLSTLTLPTSLGTIEYRAFDNCDRIKNIYYDGTEEQWNRINISSSGNFHYLFGSGTRIHYAGSPGTSSLVSGQCGQNITWSIDGNGTLAIRGFGSMWDNDYIYVPWFYRGDSIKKVVIDDDIIAIGKNAFYDCKNITNVFIPDNIVTIGPNAFYNCNGLEHIYYGGTAEQWAEINIHSSNNKYLLATTVQFHYDSDIPDEPDDPETYTVFFDANGGNVSTEEREYKANTALGTLPTPTRTGYKFNGWYTQRTGGTKVTSSTKVTADVTLYAHWTKNTTAKTYTITLNANGGKVTPASLKVESGKTYYSSLPTPQGI